MSLIRAAVAAWSGPGRREPATLPDPTPAGEPPAGRDVSATADGAARATTRDAAATVESILKRDVVMAVEYRRRMLLNRFCTVTGGSLRGGNRGLLCGARPVRSVVRR
jgi:hypothetical protein